MRPRAVGLDQGIQPCKIAARLPDSARTDGPIGPAQPMKRPPDGRSPSCTPNHREARRYGDIGTTLVETLVALTVFAVGLIAVAALASTSSRVISLALERTDATLLAGQAIERRLAERAGRFPATPPATGMDGRPYTVQVDERGEDGLVEIRAIVRGTRGGPTHSIGTWQASPP